MKTVIELAREAAAVHGHTFKDVPSPETIEFITAFAELVRADERNSWPAEMEAMERQVNILTDALNDRQRWFDALEEQHKQAILAEREACANLAQKTVCDVHIPTGTKIYATAAAKAIRARSNT